MLILFNDIDLSSIAKLHRHSTCAKKRHGGYPRNGKVNQGYSSNHWYMWHSMTDPWDYGLFTYNDGWCLMVYSLIRDIRHTWMLLVYSMWCSFLFSFPTFPRAFVQKWNHTISYQQLTSNPILKQEKVCGFRYHLCCLICLRKNDEINWWICSGSWLLICGNYW